MAPVTRKVLELFRNGAPRMTKNDLPKLAFHVAFSFNAFAKTVL